MKRPLYFILTCALVGCQAGDAPTSTTEAAIVTTCTAQTEFGFPYSGALCGGSVIDTCTPGLLYNCQGGARDATNNCTLATSCATACLTGPGDTSPISTTSTPVANDACFTGDAPLTINPDPVVGGNYIDMTATLTTTRDATPAIVNLLGATNDVPPLCDVPVEMAPGQTSLTIVEPTAVVSASEAVPLAFLISYNDTNGFTRNLVSTQQDVTLQPGGTLPTPSLTSFTISDGNGTPVSTVTGGTQVATDATLSDPAPVGGYTVSVASNPADAFSGGNIAIVPGCSHSTTSGFMTATSSLTADETAVVTASVAAGAPISHTVTVTPPTLNIKSVVLTPSEVAAGNSLTATVNLDRVVISGDPAATVSIRVSDSSRASFAGCTGSPACIGTITIAQGASSGSVTITTSPSTTAADLTIAASAPWANSSASSQLLIDAGACTPTTSCATESRVCGSLFDGCETVSCGTCSGTDTCDSTGQCVAGPTTEPLTVSVTGRSGETIVSSPAGISVVTGQSETASFTSGTSITLSDQRGRDVIWSGSCSSGGQKTRTCTFTITGPSSVTANVR